MKPRRSGFLYKGLEKTLQRTMYKEKFENTNCKIHVMSKQLRELVAKLKYGVVSYLKRGLQESVHLQQNY